MTQPKLPVIATFVAVAAVSASAFQAARQWPPAVARVSSESPVLSPADELKTLVLPPGYHLELVASEPLIQDPVVIDWDGEGRLWAVEMVGYMNDIHSEGEPPFPGESNPAIREYFWTWTQTVTRTKKGALRNAIALSCKKYIYDRSPGDPGNVQTFAC